jgi:membrane protease YdiL (CAAX protease family)
MEVFMKYIRALGWMCLLFASVYLPAFVLVGILGLSGARAVLLVILISFLFAAMIIAIFLRSSEWSRKDFGLVKCGVIYIARAIVLGGILALIITFLQRLLHVPDAPTFETFAFWQTVLLFWIGASIQEETIFRGLIQSVVGRKLDGAAIGGRLSAAAVIVAILFAVVHVPMGIFTVGAAFFVGLLAGELRVRSGSLVPAIIVHALVNIVGTIWQ